MMEALRVVVFTIGAVILFYIVFVHTCVVSVVVGDPWWHGLIVTAIALVAGAFIIGSIHILVDWTS